MVIKRFQDAMQQSQPIQPGMPPQVKPDIAQVMAQLKGIKKVK